MLGSIRLAGMAATMTLAAGALPMATATAGPVLDEIKATGQVICRSA